MMDTIGTWSGAYLHSYVQRRRSGCMFSVTPGMANAPKQTVSLASLSPSVGQAILDGDRAAHRTVRPDPSPIAFDGSLSAVKLISVDRSTANAGPLSHDRRLTRALAGPRSLIPNLIRIWETQMCLGVYNHGQNRTSWTSSWFRRSLTTTCVSWRACVCPDSPYVHNPASPPRHD